jgi:Regulator of chromosome condensation (RCC1) repeat
MTEVCVLHEELRYDANRRGPPLMGTSAALTAALALGTTTAAWADVLYVDISAGDAHTCAVKANGEIDCWGDNTFGQANPPAGRFSAVSAGGRHTCAVKGPRPGIDPEKDPEIDTVACWGLNNAGQANPPGDKFLSISAGLRHTCGVKRGDATVACWGDNSAGQATPPSVQFRFVSAGGEHTCGEEQGAQGNILTCWGNNDFGQASPPAPGKFAGGFSAGRNHTCAIKGDGGIVCWGNNDFGQATPPPGQLRGLSISAGARHTCVVKAFENDVVCWGDSSAGQPTPPAAALFQKVSAGQDHTCALRRGQIFCWGSNADRQATPPGDNPPLVNIVAQGCSPCRAGDVVRISLDFSNPGPERTVELIAVAHSPDGKTLSSFLDEDLEVSLPPGQSVMDLAPVTIPAGLTTGAFFLEAAVLHPVTGETLSRHHVVRELLP